MIFAEVPVTTTEVEVNEAVGWAAASSRSALNRCLVKPGTSVVMLATSKLIETLAAAGLAGSSSRLPPLAAKSPASGVTPM